MREPGRPNDLYHKLFTDALRHPVGTRVLIRQFASTTSAYTALRFIRSGKRPIPGELQQWVLEAHVCEVELEGGEKIKGSALWATRK